MNRKKLALASVVQTGAMAVIAVSVAVSLPADAELPIHWNMAGEADRMAGKWVALLSPAALTAGLSLFFYILPALEPRAKGLSRSQGLYHWAWIGQLVMGAAILFVVVSAALDWSLSAVHVIVGTLGVLFVLMGNQLGKTRRMYLIGIRTPWTLASEDVWIKTHRLAGKLMVLGGLVIVTTGLMGIKEERLLLFVFGVVSTVALVPVLYSILLWRREKQANGASK